MRVLFPAVFCRIYALLQTVHSSVLSHRASQARDPQSLAFLFLLLQGYLIARPPFGIPVSRDSAIPLFLKNPHFLTHFFRKICISQKKALPLHRHLPYRTDGEPTVNRQSRLTSSLCQAKERLIFYATYTILYIYI